MNLYPASKTALKIRQEDVRTRQELTEYLNRHRVGNVKVSCGHVRTKPLARHHVIAGDNSWQDGKSVKR